MDGEPLVSQFMEALDQVVDHFRDQGLTNAEAVGALEIAKQVIILEGLSEAAEDEEG